MIIAYDLAADLNTLFLTENIASYIGLLVLVLLIGYIGTKSKLNAAISAPVGLLVGLFYLANGLGWHFLILIFAAVGIMFNFALGKTK
jgi:uncharacterized membrane protein YjjP (DUF1212 family)